MGTAKESGPGAIATTIAAELPATQFLIVEGQGQNAVPQGWGRNQVPSTTRPYAAIVGTTTTTG